MLGECDRACVIKPTGTGKFVILAKMVQDNPDKRFLLLGTNDYMFNDQMANLAEIAPGIRMSLANTRTPRKRSRRRKHSYRRMGTRSMTRNMASAPLPIGL